MIDALALLDGLDAGDALALAGALDVRDARVGTGTIGHPEAGELVRLQILVDDDGIILDTRFRAFGCAAAIAGGALVARWLRGRPLADVALVDGEALSRELGLRGGALFCGAILAAAVLADAVHDFESKQWEVGT